MAELLANNSWQHAVPRGDGTYDSPVFTDAGTIARVTQQVRAGGTDAEPARLTGNTISEHAIEELAGSVGLERAPAVLGEQVARTPAPARS